MDFARGCGALSLLVLFPDSRCWNTQSNSKSINTHTQWFKVLFFDDFSGVDWPHIIHNMFLLMVIGYLYIARFARPYKAYTPLFVNSYTVLPLSVSLQLFKSIARWRSQIKEFGHTVKHLEFTFCLKTK
jgi:hypothetical protein